MPNGIGAPQAFPAPQPRPVSPVSMGFRPPAVPEHRSPVQVGLELECLGRALQLKGSMPWAADAAIVPTVDITRLLGLEPKTQHQPIDRLYSALGVAPHGSTIRWSYTVPAGRSARLLAAWVSAVRATAAGASATVQADISVTRGGLGLLLARVSFVNNTVGLQFMDRTREIELHAGDVVNGATLDLSTGGTVSYHVNGLFAEFVC